MKNGQVRQNSYLAWRLLYHDDAFDITALLKFQSRLSPRIAVHFDAIVNCTLSGLRQKRLPLFNLNWESCLVLARYYHNTLPNKQPALPTMEEHREALLTGKYKQSSGNAGNTRPDRKVSPLTSQQEQRDILIATQKSLIDTKSTTTPQKDKSKKRDKSHKPSISADSTPNKPAPEPSTSANRKRKHAAPYTLNTVRRLTPPWNQLGLAALGLGGVRTRQLQDGRVGLAPSTTKMPHMGGRIRRIWNGEVQVTAGLYDDDEWLLIEDPFETDEVLDTPDFDYDTLMAIKLVPDEKRLSFESPVSFQAIHNFDIQFCDAKLRLMVDNTFRPYFPHVPEFLQSRPIFDVNQGYEPLITTPTAGYILRYTRPSVRASKIHTLSVEQLRSLLAQYVSPPANSITNTIFTHSWWRAHVPPPSLIPTVYKQQFHKEPLLPPIGDPDVPSPHEFANRPVVDGAPTPKRPSLPFLGLTNTLAAYIHQRAEEQAYFVAQTSSHLASVYRSRSMRIFNAPYLEQSQADFPITAMHIPHAEDWHGKLNEPISYTAAYPVNDLSIRYMESLVRTHLYHNCHREQTLHILDRQLHELCEMVRLFAPSQLERANHLIDSIRAREWHFLLDSYAISTEMLATAVTTRRQGFLSLATKEMTLEDRRAALSKPFTDTVILTPEPPQSPTPSPRRSPSKSPPRRSTSKSPPKRRSTSRSPSPT